MLFPSLGLLMEALGKRQVRLATWKEHLPSGGSLKDRATRLAHRAARPALCCGSSYRTRRGPVRLRRFSVESEVGLQRSSGRYRAFALASLLPALLLGHATFERASKWMAAPAEVLSCPSELRNCLDCCDTSDSCSCLLATGVAMPVRCAAKSASAAPPPPHMLR